MTSSEAIWTSKQRFSSLSDMVKDLWTPIYIPRCKSCLSLKGWVCLIHVERPYIQASSICRLWPTITNWVLSGILDMIFSHHNQPEWCSPFLEQCYLNHHSEIPFNHFDFTAIQWGMTMAITIFSILQMRRTPFWGELKRKLNQVLLLLSRAGYLQLQNAKARIKMLKPLDHTNTEHSSSSSQYALCWGHKPYSTTGRHTWRHPGSGSCQRLVLPPCCPPFTLYSHLINSCLRCQD